MSFSFGEVVRRGREKARLSQAKVAELIGKSQSTIRAWEQGRTNPADPKAVSTLAAVLGLNEEDLLHRAGFDGSDLSTVRKTAREELSALTAEHTITLKIAPAAREGSASVAARHLYAPAATSIAPEEPVIGASAPIEAAALVEAAAPVDADEAAEGRKVFDLDEVTEIDVLMKPVELAQEAESKSLTPDQIVDAEPVDDAPVGIEVATEASVTVPLEVVPDVEVVAERATPITAKPKTRKVTAVQSLPIPNSVEPAMSYVEDEVEREFYRRRAVSTAIVCVSLVIIFWWALRRTGGAIVDFVSSLVDGLNF